MLNVCTVCKDEFESESPVIGEDDICPACYKAMFIDPMMEEEDTPLIFDQSIYDIEDVQFEDLKDTEEF